MKPTAMVQTGRHLLILGLLRRRPMSAYDITGAVRSHAHLYRELKGGNVYETLERLHELGLLASSTEPARRGPRAEKSIYRITAAGEKTFLKLLRDIVVDVQAADWLLEVSYVLLGQLPRSVALKMLVDRLAAITEQERRLGRLRGDLAERTGAAFISASHARYKLGAESKFLRDSIELLRDPSWTSTWTESTRVVREA